jgi:hypothetical protein
LLARPACGGKALLAIVSPPPPPSNSALPFRRLPTFGEPQHFAPESLCESSNDNYHARHLPLLPLGELRHQRLQSLGRVGRLISRAFLRHRVDNALDGEMACAAAGEISFLLFLLKWGARSFVLV